MSIDPEKTPMIDLLRQAYQVAEINGRHDIMMRCQAIANLAEKLDKTYQTDTVTVASKPEITKQQLVNRKYANINDIEDYMLICITNGMNYLGFAGEDFKNFFINFSDHAKQMDELEKEGL